jgi:hypothetical protein
VQVEGSIKKENFGYSVNFELRCGDMNIQGVWEGEGSAGHRLLHSAVDRALHSMKLEYGETISLTVGRAPRSNPSNYRHHDPVREADERDMAHISATLSRLDQPGQTLSDVLAGLARFPEPLRDADVAAKGGQDASGLNATILVIRHMYRVLLSLQHEATHINPLGDSRLQGHLRSIAANYGDTLAALRRRETNFSLLAAAWLGTASPSGASEQAAIRASHAEVLDAFFSTWRGPAGDLSFSSLLDGEQAREAVWNHKSLFRSIPRAMVEQADGLYAPSNTLMADSEAVEASLVKWQSDVEPSLAIQLARDGEPRGAPGKRSFTVPNNPPVLRVRYTPEETDGPGSNDLYETEVQQIWLCLRTEGGRPLRYDRSIDPLRCTYRLFAAVRLRNAAAEPDLVRVFNAKTPEQCLQPLSAGSAAPADADWQLGAAGYTYDLFYARKTVGQEFAEEPRSSRGRDDPPPRRANEEGGGVQ